MEVALCRCTLVDMSMAKLIEVIEAIEAIEAIEVIEVIEAIELACRADRRKNPQTAQSGLLSRPQSYAAK